MSPPQPDREAVWYVAYGSNLDRSRLQRYLDRSPDPTPPTDRRPLELPHRLFFAHESRVWTGGSAFVDPTHDPAAATLATAWLVTRTQFRWILAHENGRLEPHADDVRVESGGGLGAGERHAIDDRRYGLVLGCASPDHRPALTFTTPADPLPAPNTPSVRYVDTIVAGLVDGHGLDPTSARAYLAARIA